MDKASHLSVVLDLSPVQWHISGQASSHPLSLSSFLSQLLAFLNAHIACKDENSLAVFGAFPGKSILLYSSTSTVAEGDVGPPDANTYRPFKVVDSTVVRSILDQVDEMASLGEEEAPLGLVGALTKALCYVNRTTNTQTTTSGRSGEAPSLPDPRILIISVSPDQPSAYIPIMNSIFSAQKLKVTIDVCKILGTESVFLQQAAHLTGGSYLFLERPDALLQYLTMAFLPPPGIRQLLSVPTQDKIDFRAACFCHKNIVDIGFVCSVCLSIFCQPVPVCSTCRTKFPIKTLQRLNASKPPTNSPARPPTSAATPAGAVQRSASLGAGTSRTLGNGNSTAHTPAQNGTPR